MIKTFFEPLTKYGSFTEAKEFLDSGRTPLALTGMIEGQRAHFLQALGENYKYRVVITPDDLAAEKIAGEWQAFDDNVLF
nr:hypothetical protein [Lachnospiraceae bacterium]